MASPDLPVFTGSFPVNGATRLYGTIGDPIRQLRLTGIMPQVFAAVGANAVWLPFEGGPGLLELMVQALPAARGDRQLLRQVWANLLSNAVKYSSNTPFPRIEITARSNSAEHVYCVQDNGVGFDMKHYGKLFGVFERLHDAREFSGTGVGLAIVQRIVERHAGRVWAQAKLDEGATFYFSLPKEQRAL